MKELQKTKMEKWKQLQQYGLAAILLTAIIISILDFLGALDQLKWLVQRINTLNLLLLALIAGVLLLELILTRNFQEKKLPDVLGEIHQDIRSLCGAAGVANVVYLNSAEEWYDYLSSNLTNAEVDRICVASLTPKAITAKSKQREQYEKIRDTLIHKGNVEYQYVTIFDSKSRLKVVVNNLRELVRQKNLGKYLVRYFEEDQLKGIPLIKLSLVHYKQYRKEMVVLRFYRSPYGQHGDEAVAVWNHDIVKLCQQYFDFRWAQASERKISDPEKILSNNLEQIAKKFDIEIDDLRKYFVDRQNNSKG